MNTRTNPNILARLIGLLAALLAAGCAVGPDSEIIPTGGPTTLGPVAGDRDDVARALTIGLEAAEAAQLEAAWAGDTFTASFLKVESRQGVATATDLGDGQFSLSAYIEPGGDRVAQERLLNAWARRLEQLYGVEWAPR